MLKPQVIQASLVGEPFICVVTSRREWNLLGTEVPCSCQCQQVAEIPIGPVAVSDGMSPAASRDSGASLLCCREPGLALRELGHFVRCLLSLHDPLPSTPTNKGRLLTHLSTGLFDFPPGANQRPPAR